MYAFCVEHTADVLPFGGVEVSHLTQKQTEPWREMCPSRVVCGKNFILFNLLKRVSMFLRERKTFEMMTDLHNLSTIFAYSICVLYTFCRLCLGKNEGLPLTRYSI